jgi:hypothetical protein
MKRNELREIFLDIGDAVIEDDAVGSREKERSDRVDDGGGR